MWERPRQNHFLTPSKPHPQHAKKTLSWFYGFYGNQLRSRYNLYKLIRGVCEQYLLHKITDLTTYSNFDVHKPMILISTVLDIRCSPISSFSAPKTSDFFSVLRPCVEKKKLTDHRLAAVKFLHSTASYDKFTFSKARLDLF